MKALFFSLVILCTSSFGFSNTESFQDFTCEAPVNLSITAQSSKSISFDWDDCTQSFTEYRIFYKRNGQSSPVYSSSKSEFSFSGLAPGVYQFHFYTVCGSVSNAIIIEETIYG